MNDNAQKLVAALRSGEFQQTTGRLRRGDKFCCLGVACELYRREVGGEWLDEGRGMFGFDGSEGVLPLPVQKWLGFSTDEGHSEEGTLAEDNDLGESFEQIADTIEREPEGLFV